MISAAVVDSEQCLLRSLLTEKEVPNVPMRAKWVLLGCLCPGNCEKMLPRITGPLVPSLYLG